MNEWKAFMARIAFFPGMPLPSPLPSALDLYRRVWGGDPESFQKSENALIPSVAKSRRGGLIVNCVTEPKRIIFDLTAVPKRTAQMTMNLIDHPIDIQNTLTDIIDINYKKPILNSVLRVAFNMHFLSLRPTYTEANKAVNKIIPNQYGVTLKDEEDFIFQINRPRSSREHQDIKINFITKWSVENFHVLAISIPIGGMPATSGINASSPNIERFIAAKVLFDNNNTPIENRTLTSQEQSDLLRESLDEVVRMQREIGLNIEGF